MNSTLAYIRYFFYLAWHWSFPLALFIVRREIKGEKLYNHFSTGIDDLTNSVSENDRLHASLYQPVNFYTAEKLFKLLPKDCPKQAILDGGCGKGRALAIAAHFGYKRLYGFDISAEMVMYANSSLSHLFSVDPELSVELEVADAANYIVPDAVDTIFLFNPFDAFIMRPFISRVKESLIRSPRKLWILYANPVHKDLWIGAGFLETNHFIKMHWLEGSILFYQSK